LWTSLNCHLSFPSPSNAHQDAIKRAFCASLVKHSTTIDRHSSVEKYFQAIHGVTCQPATSVGILTASQKPFPLQTMNNNININETMNE